MSRREGVGEELSALRDAEKGACCFDADIKVFACKPNIRDIYDRYGTPFLG